MSEKNTHTPWNNRIVGSGSKPASQFQAHPHNFRTHPQSQRRAVRASLDDLGWIDVVIENVTTGHLIDGHERIWNALQNGDAEVPYIQVELTEAEEAQALLSLDPIAAMAGTDKAQLDELLGMVETANADVDLFLRQLAASNGLIEDVDYNELWKGMPEFENEPKAARSLYIHFATHKDVDEFISILGLSITEKTKSIWFPDKIDNLHMNKDLIYES